jgi:hypothetical protein
MSLDDLPTELDDHIIGYLDMADTNSISRVDKYYRKLSEPHLYEHLNARKNNPRRLRLLLRTLLCHKDLRPLIKGLVLNLSRDESVTLQLLTPPNDRQITSAVLDPQGDAFYQDLQSLLIHINDAINGIVGSELPAQFKMAWFGKIFEPYSLFDGALSLILCMATSLQSFDLQVSDYHPLPVTLEVPTLIDWYTMKKTNVPFQNLQHVAICSNGQLDNSYPAYVVPGLRELHISGNSSLSEFNYPWGTGNRALSKLVMDGIIFDPRKLQDVVESTWFRNLEYLHISAAGRGSYSDMYEYQPFIMWRYDFGQLKDAMVKHCPRLREFWWISMQQPEPEQDFMPFGSFAAFTELEELRIEYTMLAGIDQEMLQSADTLSALSDMLPPKLTVLQLDGVQWQAFANAFKPPPGQGVYEEQADALTNLQSTATVFPLKEIAFTLDMETWVAHDRFHSFESWQFQEPAIDSFRTAVEQLAGRDIRCEVWYFMDPTDSAKKLVTPNYFATTIEFGWVTGMDDSEDEEEQWELVIEGYVEEQEEQSEDEADGGEEVDYQMGQDEEMDDGEA